MSKYGIGIFHFFITLLVLAITIVTVAIDQSSWFGKVLVGALALVAVYGSYRSNIKKKKDADSSGK